MPLLGHAPDVTVVAGLRACHPGAVAPSASRSHRAAALVASVLLVGAAGCAGDDGSVAQADEPVRTVVRPVPTTGLAASGGPSSTTAPTVTALAPTSVPPAPSTTTAVALTTASTVLAAPCALPWEAIDVPAEPAPPALRRVLAERLADPRFAAVTLGASVWIEGYGEVVAVRPDELLIPASGQKLVTSVGALSVLSPHAVPLPVEAPGQATWQLVHAMLVASANDHTDALLGQVGAAVGGPATVAGGLGAAHTAAERLCAPLDGVSVDGSGLSTANRHSARSLRRLLQAVLPSPIGYTVSAGLSVGGASGTLLPRFVGTPAEGNVRAKTGSLDGVVSLTGHLQTQGGRLVVFSLIANGPGATSDGAGPATQVLDDLVVALAADPT